MSNHSFKDEIDSQKMGLMTSFRWTHEPNGVLFMLARYKFVAKMLQGYARVLEVGCGDGFGARIVAPYVGKLIGIDIDKQMIESAVENQSKYGIEFSDMNYILMKHDAIYALDVIEHISKVQSEGWLKMLSDSAPVVIIGTPSLEFQTYASKLSKENHINCMTGPELKTVMKEYFKHVFMFSMNDEIVHTGFSPMSCYNFALGVN